MGCFHRSMAASKSFCFEKMQIKSEHTKNNKSNKTFSLCADRCALCTIRDSIVVRTPGPHPGNPGSIPGHGILSHINEEMHKKASRTSGTKEKRAQQGIEPWTSRTRSENHATRPLSHRRRRKVTSVGFEPTPPKRLRP
jgi:hypothetical protein